jgi:class 3 adenylate cyclase/tetratricopeptide (TPR) repeat protein
MARNINAWLNDLGLGKYVDVFAENEIDFDALRHLTEEDLREIGIALGARRKLLAAISELGQAAVVAEVPTDEPLGERRQVTVLFADLSNFTQLSSELGAEATHALLNHYFETVDGIVEGYGGTIDKHIGDNVMAVFGAPVAHSDDPERAVRAALDIHSAMNDLSDDFGRPLTAHIGIASGQVVASGTGSVAHRQYTVTGETVNLASRLQDQAAAGETLISDAVRHMMSGLADCSALGEIEVKGFAAPISVWLLGGLCAVCAPSSQTLFVGRDRERRQFSGVVDECLETGRGQVLLVRGEAGIGKSRLIAEFESEARGAGFAVRKGLVLDFGVGKGQDAIRSLVRHLMGIPTGSDKRERAAAADATVSAGTLAEEQRVFLNDLLDLPQPVAQRSLYDAMENSLRNEGKRAVVTRLLAEDARRQPLLVIVEDIHWADKLTLAHLAAMAAMVAECPAILVMTSRVEGDPLTQAWRASTRGSPLTTIDLGQLRQEEAEVIAANLLEAGGDLARDCIAKAEGNPLFLEQLLRNASEGAREQIPGSIQSLVQARMDRLRSVDKEALQVASIIGQRFTLDALRHLLGDSDYDCLSLEQHHLVSPEGESYLFAHALVREGVYASLLTDRRRSLHRKAAEWFADQDLELRAEHLDRAEDPRAVAAYREAAEAQAVAYRFEGALGLIARGLDLATDAGQRSDLTCLRGDLLHDSGDTRGAIEAYIEARDLAVDEPQRCKAEIGFAAGMRIVDRYDEAFAALGRAEPIAAAHGLHLELAKLHYLRGNLYFPLGEIDRCKEEHAKALDCARTAGSPEWEAQALGGLADAAYARGHLITTDSYLDQCLELCRLHGFGRIEVAHLLMKGGGGTNFYRGDLKAALQSSVEADEMARAVGHDRAAIIAHSACYIALFAMGDKSGAWSHVEQAKELIEKIGAKRFMARALQYEGKIALWEGRQAEALSILHDALAISRETGIQYVGPSLLADIAFTTEDADERRATLAEGEALLQGGGVGHNFFEFYGLAIDTSLKSQNWEEAERYAAALEDYTRLEPLALCDLLIARGRALAAVGRGRCDAEILADLRRLSVEAERIGLTTALPALNEALRATAHSTAFGDDDVVSAHPTASQ